MRKKATENSPIFDIIQLFFSLTAIFFLLSLVSYSPDDPSFFTIVNTKEPVMFKNLFGNVGAQTAAILGKGFGWASLILPFLFIYISVLLHRYKKRVVSLASPILAFVYGFCIIVSLSVLSGLIGGGDPLFQTQPSGGSLGVIGSYYAVSFIGKVGGIIVFFVLILAFTMLLFSLTFSDIGELFIKTAKKISAFFSLFRRNKVNSDKKTVHTKPKNDDSAAKNNTSETDNYDEDPDSDFSYFEETVPQDNDIHKEDSLFAEDVPVEIKAAAETEKVKFDDYAVPIKLLSEPNHSYPQDSDKEVHAKGELLVEKLKDFGVFGRVRNIQRGPVVTMFEYEPAPGTRVNKISSLDNDLALNMSAVSVRIIAPIPGTNAVGIEMPNKHRATVYLKELFQSSDFVKNKNPLAVALGKDAVGNPYMADVAKMPHLLVAGTTGSGKSVALNVMICSILFKSAPDKVKFIMIDPKAVELSIYDGIPHMLAPVVTDPKLASSVLKNVAAEMDRRYNLFKEIEVRGIEPYNRVVSADGSAEPMPYIVVIVDEFADLMMIAGKEVEASIIRIAQKARAAGIHLIIATQRPDSNVITGLIRSNMPARLALRVSQKLNSRIILDQNGAETLLGRGDSLFLPPGSSDLVRVHGAFVGDDEVREIVRYLKTLGEPEYDMSMVKEETENTFFDDEDEDPEYARALDVAYEKGTVSISMIQRQLRIGYNRAARIVETMERRGIIGPSDGTAKPRQVNR